MFKNYYTPRSCLKVVKYTKKNEKKILDWLNSRFGHDFLIEARKDTICIYLLNNTLVAQIRKKQLLIQDTDSSTLRLVKY